MEETGSLENKLPKERNGKINKFERWFETNLLNNVETGCTIIMDRASFHRKKQLEEICGKVDVNLLFLPAYSPDFNPIEKDWANHCCPV